MDPFPIIQRLDMFTTDRRNYTVPRRMEVRRIRLTARADRPKQFPGKDLEPIQPGQQGPKPVRALVKVKAFMVRLRLPGRIPAHLLITEGLRECLNVCPGFMERLPRLTDSLLLLTLANNLQGHPLLRSALINQECTLPSLSSPLILTTLTPVLFMPTQSPINTSMVNSWELLMIWQTEILMCRR
ncbi:MAG: hypothetical protein B1H13_08480 [Desulfobacteraceae bacterium 4484_190.3]|nr:MAG: hypothetical protein B1H13_08480 [Desulfobacteraceae bacterium 4484_190.3]